MSTQESGSVKAKSDEIAHVWQEFAKACSYRGVKPDRFDNAGSDDQKFAHTVAAMLNELEKILTRFSKLKKLVSETRQKLDDVSNRSSPSPPPPSSPVPAVPQRFEPTDEAKRFIRDHAERFAAGRKESVTDVYSERCTRIHVVEGTFARCIAFQAYKTNTEAKESLLAWIAQVVNSESTEKRWSDEIRTWLHGGLCGDVLEAAVTLMCSCKLRTLRAYVARMQISNGESSVTKECDAWVVPEDALKFAQKLIHSRHRGWKRALSWGAYVLASCTRPFVSTMWRVYSGAPMQRALFSETCLRTCMNVLTWLHVKAKLRKARDVWWLFATADESTPRADYLHLQHAALIEKQGAEDLNSIFDTDDVHACVNLLSEFQLFYPAPATKEVGEQQTPAAVPTQQRGTLPPTPWSFALYRNAAILITSWTPNELRDDPTACVVDLKTFGSHKKESQERLRAEVKKARGDLNVVLLVYFRNGAPRKELFDANMFPHTVNTAVDLSKALHDTAEARRKAARAATQAATHQAAADEATTGQPTSTSAEEQYEFVVLDDAIFRDYVNTVLFMVHVRQPLFNVYKWYWNELGDLLSVKLPTPAATVAAPASTSGAVEVSGAGK